MQTQTRKSFFQSLATLAAGSLLMNKVNAAGIIAPYTVSTPLQKKKRVLRVAHLTDIHVKPERIAENGMAAALAAVNNMPDKVDFIINGGDSIMNAASFSKEKVKEQWQSYHAVMRNNNSLPIHSCIGNHDLYGWAIPGTNHKEGKLWAMEEYGMDSPYYTFSKNGWHFIVLDSIHARKSVPGYYGKIDLNQMQWLKNTLMQLPSNEPICVVSHIPILAVCSFFDTSYVNNNHWFVPDNTLHSDAKELRDLFLLNKNVKACLSGHIHLIDHVNYLSTDYYCNGAVSGAWWKGNHQQFPPSFIIMNFYDDGSTEREVHYYDWNSIS